MESLVKYGVNFQDYSPGTRVPYRRARSDLVSDSWLAAYSSALVVRSTTFVIIGARAVSPFLAGLSVNYFNDCRWSRGDPCSCPSGGEISQTLPFY